MGGPRVPRREVLSMARIVYFYREMSEYIPTEN